MVPTDLREAVMRPLVKNLFLNILLVGCKYPLKLTNLIGCRVTMGFGTETALVSVTTYTGKEKV